MSGWDDGQTFFSDALSSQDGGVTTGTGAKKLFFDFIRNFRDHNDYIYRSQLRRHYHLKQYHLEVDLDDLIAFNDELANRLQTRPTEMFPLFESAAKDAAFAAIQPLPEGEDEVHPIQVTLTSSANPVLIRELGAANVSRLIKVQGIVISASPTQAKATELTIQCRNCATSKKWPVGAGLGGATLPRACDRTPVSDEEARCPVDPYVIVPDKCQCVDQQKLKLQELPEMVPTGEMPRHMLLSADRALVDKVVPGSRCTVIGIYGIFQAKGRGSGSPVRQPYIRVTGIELESAGSGRMQTTFSPDEVEEMLQMAKDPEIYDNIVKSIAPSIWGNENIKKAAACLLFGGAAKRLPDGTRLRGDVNVLVLGDPGTAKSQILKFVEKVAPISVYTSGKGSSAAGLTASVVRDVGSREFYLEGGAMVLADGGVVCIDEFDKMRESDRVAIHEAMEQQTISIAKAGITTTLNSRTSVMAAANSAFGRWDDTKDADENIEFQSTILSRFDLIFIVRDEHNEARDATLARFVMNVHLRAEDKIATEGEISIETLKKYIQYCRMKCGPRLSKEAGEKLKDHFVRIRSETHKMERRTGKRATIPITVRQLEALVRLTESLAKMRMMPFATEEHVEEAMRLFKVSTMQASNSSASSGMDAAGGDDLDTMLGIEKSLKTRFPVGSRVSESRIVSELTKQNYAEESIRKVLGIMLRRGEVEHQMQRRVLYRVK